MGGAGEKGGAAGAAGRGLQDREAFEAPMGYAWTDAPIWPLGPHDGKPGSGGSS